MAVVTKPTAREKLSPSKLDVSQQELMGDDVDISDLLTWFKGVAGVDLEAATTDINIRRTIEGASTVTVNVTDQDRLLLRSGKLSSRQDIKIDGLWFRLAAVNKTGKNLTLTFEDREVAILRTYDKPIKQTAATNRTQMTRAHFVLKMLQEVREQTMQYYIPELNVSQPLDGAAQVKNANIALPIAAGGQGIPMGTTLLVKTVRMSNTQRINANTMLTVGTSMGVERALLVVSIMAAIQESSIINLDYGHPGDYNYLGPDPAGNPRGVLQQIKKYGWPASGDVGTDAQAFFLKVKQYTGSNLEYYQIAEKVQGSGNGSAYGQWRLQAELIVTEYGHPPDKTALANSQYELTNNTGAYEFYRGLPPTSTTRKQKYGSKWGPESTWDCMQRLASEVNWRAFCSSAIIYFIDEQELFKSQPIAILDEDSPGWMEDNCDYDEGKKIATMQLTVRMGRWSAPPGTVIQIQNMGPWNGRWLVNDVERSAYNSQGTITLKKPMPKLPEPSSSNIIGSTKPATWTGAPAATDTTSTIGRDQLAAKDSATRILAYWKLGQYRDDNGQQIAQLKKIADGKMLHNECGRDVAIHPLVMTAILGLLDDGFYVGTYAICEDHSCNAGQHPAGQAVDISSLGNAIVGWHALNTVSFQGRALAMDAMRKLQPVAWDLICNGVGQLDSAVQALQMDNGAVRGGVWEVDHINHIHCGVVPGYVKGQH